MNDLAGFAPIFDPRFAFVLTWWTAMVRACWQGGVAIALVWIVCRALPKMPPRLRCYLWRLAYLKLLVALVWSSTVDLRLLPPPAARPVHETPSLPRQRLAKAAPAPSSPPAKSKLPPARIPYVAGAMMLSWLLVVLVLVARFVRECAAIRRLRRRCRPVDDEIVIESWKDLCKQFGLHRRFPQLLQSEDLEGPVVVGMWRPTIIVPSFLIAQELYSCAPGRSELNSKISSATANDLAPMSATHGRSSQLVELLLAHELAHVKRRDLLWGVLPGLAQICFCFHPLVWLAWREWKLAHESACDELALLTTNASIADYGNVLLKVATNHRSPLRSSLVAVGVVESFETLKRRLVMMEHVGQVTRKRLLLTGALVIALGAVGIVPWRVVAQITTPTFTFTTIDFPGARSDGNVGTHAFGINNLGEIVGSFDGNDGHGHSFLRDTNGNLTEIAVPGSINPAARGINDAGQIVGYSSAGGVGAWLRNTNGSITEIIYPGALYTAAHGINNAGQIVGAYTYSANGLPFHGFLRSADGSSFTTIDFTGSTSTELRGINNVGQIVGNSYVGFTTHGFLRDTNRSFTTINFGALGNVALGINHAGQIVGAYYNGQPSHGFIRDTNGSFATIDVPGGWTNSNVYGINKAMQVVGEYGWGLLGSGGGPVHGYLAVPIELLPPPSPRDLINSLRNEVKGLSGLTLRQTNELVEKLDEASLQLARGHKKQAVEALRDFIEQVKELVKKKLTAAQGSQLTGEANDIIKLIGPTKDKDDDKDKDDKKDDKEKKEGRDKKK